MSIGEMSVLKNNGSRPRTADDVILIVPVFFNDSRRPSPSQGLEAFTTLTNSCINPTPRDSALS